MTISRPAEAPVSPFRFVFSPLRDPKEGQEALASLNASTHAPSTLFMRFLLGKEKGRLKKKDVITQKDHMYPEEEEQQAENQTKH